MDQKNQYDDSKYDELKEKLLKAGTQKTIIRDQVRGDTEEGIAPKEVWTRSLPLVSSAMTYPTDIHFIQALL